MALLVQLGQALVNVEPQSASRPILVSVTYAHVTGYLELNVGWTQLTPEVLGQKRDLSGVTLYPAVGVAYGF